MPLKVAVIIPVRGNAPYLHDCLRSVLANTYPYKEVIVVDDGLAHPAREMLVQFSGSITILDNHARGPSFGRNTAAGVTAADFIAFTDSDCITHPDWLAELLRGFTEVPGVVACGGTQQIPDDATAFEKKVFLFMQRSGFVSEYVRTARSAAIVAVNHNASCNVMYKRDIFLSIGGFAAGLWPGEDVELDYRLIRKGYTIITNPAAIVKHYRPKSLKAFAVMMFRYGLAQGFLVRKYGFFRLMHFLPAVVLSVSVILPFVLPFNILVSFLALAAAAYAVLSVIFKFNIGLTNIAISACIFWHVGFLRGLIRPNTCHVK